MRIYIDGDSCNVIQKTEIIARKHNVECHIFCDTKRLIESDYSQVHIVDCRPDAVDFAILKSCERGDVVITNDAELASFALTRGCSVLNTQGKRYTRENISSLLAGRYLRRKEVERTRRKNIKKTPMSNFMPHYESYSKSLDSVIKSKIRRPV